MIEESGMPILQNWMTQEQILPLSLETFEIDPKVINAPKTLQDLAIRYRNKKNIFDWKEQDLNKPEDNSKFHSFLNSFLADVLVRCIYSCAYNSDHYVNHYICIIWTI